jgi:hypothetical protein
MSASAKALWSLIQNAAGAVGTTYAAARPAGWTLGTRYARMTTISQAFLQSTLDALETAVRSKPPARDPESPSHTAWTSVGTRLMRASIAETFPLAVRKLRGQAAPEDEFSKLDRIVWTYECFMLN